MSVKVSILIPAYNHAQFIRACLDSVVQQTYQDWEAIVIDDGSSDETPSIIQEYAKKDKRIQFKRQENAGVVITCKRALDIAKGKYANFLASDDKFTKQRLERLVPVLDAQPSTCLVCSDVYGMNADGKINQKLMLPQFKMFIQKNNGKVFAGLLEQNFIYSVATLFRRSIATEVGGIDETIPFLEDWSLWLRMTENHTIEYIDEPLACYRQHNQNATKNVQRTYEAMRKTFHQYVRRLSFTQRLLVTARVLARYNFEEGSQYEITQDRISAKKSYFLAMLRQPLNTSYRQAWSRLLWNK